MAPENLEIYILIVEDILSCIPLFALFIPYLMKHMLIFMTYEIISRKCLEREEKEC